MFGRGNFVEPSVSSEVSVSVVDSELVASVVDCALVEAPSLVSVSFVGVDVESSSDVGTSVSSGRLSSDVSSSDVGEPVAALVELADVAWVDDDEVVVLVSLSEAAVDVVLEVGWIVVVAPASTIPSTDSVPSSKRRLQALVISAVPASRQGTEENRRSVVMQLYARVRPNYP